MKNNTDSESSAISKTISALIKRHAQKDKLHKRLGKVGVSVGFLEDFFEIDLVISLMSLDIAENNRYLEKHLSDVLVDICETINDSRAKNKTAAAISAFNDLLYFYRSGLDHGGFFESDQCGTTYINKEGDRLDHETLCKKYCG